MRVEWEVRGVDGNVMGHEAVQAFVDLAVDALRPAPEHAVVQDQEVGVGIQRRIDGPAGEINGGRDAAYRPPVVELQSVQCPRIVREA